MMNFQIGKIYNMPTNFYFYKANQPRLLMEYCKKIKIPERKIINIDIDKTCIEYCKNIVLFPENDDPEPDEEKKSISNSDDDSWIDMKKYL
jgi:hypothetical protein